MDTAGTNLKVVSTMSVGYGVWAHVLPRVEILLTGKNRPRGPDRTCETGCEARLHSRCIERRWWVDYDLFCEPHEEYYPS